MAVKVALIKKALEIESMVDGNTSIIEEAREKVAGRSTQALLDHAALNPGEPLSDEEATEFADALEKAYNEANHNTGKKLPGSRKSNAKQAYQVGKAICEANYKATKAKLPALRLANADPANPTKPRGSLRDFLATANRMSLETGKAVTQKALLTSVEDAAKKKAKTEDELMLAAAKRIVKACVEKLGVAEKDANAAIAALVPDLELEKPVVTKPKAKTNAKAASKKAAKVMEEPEEDEAEDEAEETTSGDALAALAADLGAEKFAQLVLAGVIKTPR